MSDPIFPPDEPVNSPCNGCPVVCPTHGDCERLKCWEPTAEEKQRVVPADNFVGTIAVNVDNDKLTDEQFRSLVRDSLPIVIYHSGVYELYEDSDKGNGPRIKEVK